MPPHTMTPLSHDAASPEESNPLLAAWTGPHGGFPHFDRVQVDAFKPAMTAGMDLQRLEIAAIAGERSAPSFDNTFAALDDSGRPLKRAAQIFQIYASTMGDKRTQAVES